MRDEARGRWRREAGAGEALREGCGGRRKSMATGRRRAWGGREAASCQAPLLFAARGPRQGTGAKRYRDRGSAAHGRWESLVMTLLRGTGRTEWCAWGDIIPFFFFLFSFLLCFML